MRRPEDTGSRHLEFGAFRVDRDGRTLLRDGEPVPLTPKTFDTLLLLLERRGRLVSKDDLMQALWPDTAVCDSNLTQTVFMLRKALGESATDARYVVTVPGRGYRFAAEVREGTAVEAASRGSAAPEAAAPRAAPPAWRRPAASVAVLLLAVLAAGHAQWTRATESAPPGSSRAMLAVLPFENLTGDPAQEYFSDGLTEEMISQLGRLDPAHLGVIARASVMHYKHTQAPLGQIARELGVQFLLEGSVRRDGSRVRIAAQLTPAGDEAHLWTREYDRELRDLLSVQADIAREIAVEIQRTVGGTGPAPTPAPAAVSSRACESYDLYLRGRYFWNRRTPEGFRQAVDAFQAAVASDPGCAPAYAGLADTYALMSTYDLVSPSAVMPKARAAALRALQIDDSLAEAHTSLASVAQNFDWDAPTAEREYRRAIQLNPSYATAHHWYAEYLGWRGRFDEALEESERARRLDPLSMIIAADRGVLLYMARQYDRAIAQFQDVAGMDPSFGRAHMVALPYVETGRFAEALADVEGWERTSREPWPWAMEAYVQARAGHPRRARAAFDEARQRIRGTTLNPAPLYATMYAAMGDTEESLNWLEKAIAARENIALSLEVDPAFDRLRGNPRFQEIVRRVGFER